MSFAVPLFLLAAAAGIIPVVVHLIHRQKAREVPFPTLRFLRLSVERTRRRKYVDDLALLLVRVAILVLVAVGLARPILHRLDGLIGGGQARAVAIVLDNSASMALSDDGAPRFESARQAAELILDGLRPGDSVALLPTGGPPDPATGKLQRNLANVRQALAQGQPGAGRADLAGALTRAITLLDQANTPQREIYVLTDNQAVSWEGLADAEASTTTAPAPAPARPIPTIVVDLDRAPAPNVSLVRVSLRSAAPVAGVPVRARVELRNAAPVAQQKHLELHLDGAPQSVSPTLDLSPGGLVAHEFTFTPDRPGVHRGEVRLAEPDGSPLDNALYFAVTVDPQVPVAVIKPRRHEIAQADDAFYLERALGLGGSVRLTTLTPDEVSAGALTGQAVVYLVNLPAPGPALADLLRDYVRAGGHLVWICGSNVDPAAYNAMNEAAGGDLLPAPLEPLRVPGSDTSESWSIGSLDAGHPVLAPLTEPAMLYRSVLVFKQFLMAADATSGARVLARLENGSPLMAERAVERGSVLLLGTGIVTDWANLPVKPLFLPLVARLTFHLAGSEASRDPVIAGASVPIMLRDDPDASRPAEMEVVRPSGEILRVRGDSKTGGRTFAYADTFEPGVYLFRPLEPGAPRTLAVAVNPDPSESDPAPLPREALQARFGPGPLVYCEGSDELDTAIRRLREGTPLGPWFLVAVLTLLVVESFLANRGGHRVPLPPGSSAPSPSLRTEQHPGAPPDERLAEFLGSLGAAGGASPERR